MKLSTIIFATICYAAALPTYAQEPAQAPAPARMQYENWQQLPPQVRAALLFIMAAGFDSMAATEEQGLDPNSAKAHALFLELVLKLDVSFMDNGQDRLYFETMLNINRERLTALQALPESAGHAEVEAIRTQHAEKLKAVKNNTAMRILTPLSPAGYPDYNKNIWSNVSRLTRIPFVQPCASLLKN